MSIEIDNLVRTHILNMKPYSSARNEYVGNDGIFLDANENPFGSVCTEIHNRYPDPMQEEMKIKLAKLENVSTNQLFIGNGSDECIDVFVRVFCEPQKEKILICPPVFSMYEHVAHIQNIEVVNVLLKDDFQLDVDGILNAIKNHTIKIIFICSPNNPTGNLINENDIEIILKNFDGLVLIDEAYQDFSNNVSWINRLQEFKNLVVIKTRSKAYGMADVRIGMLYAHAEIIQYLNTIKMPYNVNAHSQRLAAEALDKMELKNKFVDELIQGRRYLETALKEIKCVENVYPSDANYILIKVADANKMYQHLIQHKLIVRNRDNAPMLKGCLRVSVGTKQENEQFIDALKRYN